MPTDKSGEIFSRRALASFDDRKGLHELNITLAILISLAQIILS
jgi:hypothetical protein